jgi:hypothetical protein
MLTSGGAGAYLSGTHPMPDELRVPDHERLNGGEEGTERRYERVGAYPEVGESRRLARGILWPPIVTHTPSFGILTGVLYALLGFFFALALRDGAPDFGELADLPGPLDLVGDALGPIVVAALLAALLLAGLVGFAKFESTPRRIAFGVAHWIAHLAVAFAATVLILGLIAGDGADPPGPFLSELIVCGALFAVGFLWGPVAFALYVFAALGIDGRAHANEVFAGQSRGAGSGYKHFVRIRVGADGAEFHPVAIDGIPKRFFPLAAGSGAGEEDEWFDSSGLRWRSVPDPEAPFTVR